MSRHRLVVSMLLALLLTWGSLGQAQVCPGSTSYIPSDYEEVVVGAGAVSLTPAKIPQAATNLGMAFVSVEGNTISYLFVGTPTATVGHQALAGASFYTIQHSNLINRNDGNGNVLLGSNVVSSMVPAQTIGAGATITADACGTVKRITAASPVTTSTGNTFTAPGAWLVGCRMTVRNVGSNTITLSNNTNFKAVGAVDLPMPANSGVEVTLIGDTTLVNTVWWQTGPLVQN